jgi:branched-chain amino acid transport system ATP-binding protein
VNLIEVSDLHAGYGGAPILNGVNLAIEAEDIGVIVGPNGAGKSTILKTIFGLVSASRGSIRFEGREIINAEPDALVPLGLSFVPQEFNVFTSMTVEENLEMGAYIRRDDILPTLRSVYAMFPDLEAKRRQKAGELSGGQRQMVAMGRALMSHPKLLLLDEPSAGLAPVVVQQVFELVKRIRASGLTVLIVEQNVQQVLKVVDRAYLLEAGSIRASGTAAEMLSTDTIKQAYLGV